jgi:hypothetical protein
MQTRPLGKHMASLKPRLSRFRVFEQASLLVLRQVQCRKTVQNGVVMTRPIV